MISYSIIWIIIGLLLISQLILAVFNKRNILNAAKRVDFLVSSYTNVVDMLQGFSQVYKAIPIKVNASIPVPALFFRDTLLVNRDWVYTHRALPSLWVIRELCRADYNVNIYRRKLIQQLIFALQLLGLVIVIFSQQWGGLFFVIFLQLAVIMLGFIIEYNIQHINYRSIEIAVDLLDLTPVEEKKALNMLEVWYGQGFTYPLDIIFQVIHFFSPNRKSRSVP